MFTRNNIARMAVVALAAITLSGCGIPEFFEELGAVRTFKDANTAYGRGFYDEAIELYGEVVEVIDASGAESELAQNLTPATSISGTPTTASTSPAPRTPWICAIWTRRSDTMSWPSTRFRIPPCSCCRCNISCRIRSRQGE